MDLEMRVLQVVDLGLTNYGEVCELQEEIVKARTNKIIPDTLIVTQHTPAIIFGLSKKSNRYSQEFIKELKEKLGENYSEAQARNYLKSLGIAVYDGDRGGGASVVAPGQLIFYPILDLSGIEVDPAKKDDHLNLIRQYRPHVVNTMFDVLHKYVTESLKVAVIGFSNLAQDVKTDVHYESHGRKHKLGSLGLRMRRINDMVVTSHGFALYIDESGLQHFEKITPCGFEHEEVTVASVEGVIKNRISHDEVVNNTISRFAVPFKYDRIERVPAAVLYNALGLKY